MSRLIEAIKARTKELSKRSQNGDEVAVEKSGREITQEQLADIYFSSTGKLKTTEPPVIIRVVEKPRLASLIPWIITSIAFLITAFSLLSTKKIFVDIRVVDENNPYLTSVPAQQRMTVDDSLPQTRELSGSVKAVKLSMQDFTFEGAAYLKSSKEKSSMTLVNSSVASFARASLHFDPSLNLAGAKIIFYARGNRGGENLALALKDSENTQAFYKGKTYPFKNNLTTAWQKAEIYLSDAAKGFNAGDVTSLRFEFGSKDTENKPGDTIFIRDLQWVVPS